MSSQEEIIRDDLSKLVIQQPFFACIILSQELVITHDVNTCAVDGKHLFCNPQWYLSMDPKERITVMAHEAMHLTNKHNIRRGDRDRRLWNVATDIAINKHLVRDPFKLPRDDTHTGQYDDTNRFGDGADAEYIYSCIYKDAMDKAKEIEDQMQNDDDDNDAESPQESEPNPSDDNQSNDDESPSDDANDSSDSEPDGSSGESQMSDALDQAIEQIREDMNLAECGEVLDHPDIGTIDKSELEIEMNITTQKAMNIAKKRGNMPTSVIEEIERSYDEKVNWRDVLSQWVDGICPADYNWLYPNDVHLQDDIILPSMKAEGYGKIMVAIDTSGSMSNEELQMAVSEVFNALQAFFDNQQEDASVQLVYCDSVIHSVETIYSASQVTNPKGRGGTSFSPVFDYVKKMPEPPMGLIFITDGYCSVYAYDKPPCDVVWLLTSMSANQFDTPFGKCIEAKVEV